MRCFNPRAREGRDTRKLFEAGTDAEVSIHAPARGATSQYCTSGMGKQCVSIHAPARGATKTNKIVVYDHNRFNPRAREGRDLVNDKSNVFTVHVSIHAPARGATLSRLLCRRQQGFQSTRPRGARLETGFCLRSDPACFNPRAREGRDVFLAPAVQYINEFQSTRPRGARLID